MPFISVILLGTASVQADNLKQAEFQVDPNKTVTFVADNNTEIIINPLSRQEKEWIGNKVYRNECAANPKYLIHWGKGEEFPSLGIAHFIWYPQDVTGPFQQTFPEMVEFVSKYQAPPSWLSHLKNFNAPWANAAELAETRNSQPIKDLQAWLLETKAYQAEFVVGQFQKRLDQYFKNHPEVETTHIVRVINKLLEFKEGRFALIDYVNFKGVGNAQEQYQGEQWGLISVLSEMTRVENESLKSLTSIESISQDELLRLFVESAKKRLQLRVELAPEQRNERRWIKGWFKRLDGYLQGLDKS